jgi:biopolymer transport protein ExbB
VKRLLSLLIAVGGISLASGTPLHAADTLEQLLEQTREARALEEARDRDREQAFLAARDQQARLLAEAEEARRAAEQRSQDLSTLYDENEKLLDELDARLQERSGNIAELFGVVRQISGDTANSLEQSLISAEFPDRVDFLRGLAAKKGVPTAVELEKLWFEILREMTESGRVVRRSTEVIGPGGEPESADVVRLGPFGAASDGRFLA